MSTRQENRRIMEQRLFDAAIDLFCEQGYKQTTLVDIAAEAGVSTRTLYKYFPNKALILERFTKENILALKGFAAELPADMPLRDKVLEIMTRDFKYMFCLFDTSYILHAASKADDLLSRSELHNVFETESIYRKLMTAEQLNNGLEPNKNAALGASVVMAIYRHCNDVYRFKNVGRFDEGRLRTLFADHVDMVWDSLYQALLSTEPTDSIAGIDRHLFGIA